MTNTVMIVDDIKLNIDLLARFLGDKYIIIPATGGESAMKLMCRYKPDIVLLDVFMPGTNGFDVLRYMRGNPELSSIPVIFVTGEREDNIEEKGLVLGAVDYIKKPFNPIVIAAKVQNHLELKTYRDNLEGLVKERTMQLAASREAIIMGMSLMSESHDKVTGEHLERIKSYTRILVHKMLVMFPGIMTSDLAEQTILYSPLHDIGKIGISDIILKKTGKLTPEEFHIMESHTLEGAKLLQKTKSYLTGSADESILKTAIDIAECHHERYDGTGYPHKFKGEEIPFAARIVAVADVYDALRSPRPYKTAFSHDEAVYGIIESETGGIGHFDPRVTEVFRAVCDEFELIYTYQDCH